MAIVKQYHKDTNTTYVYESESYWDPEKKQSRSRRRVIGKIDPETGEMIPTGTRGRKKKQPEMSAPEANADQSRLMDLYSSSQEKVKAQADRIRTLEQEISSLRRQNDRLVSQMRKADSLLQQSRQILTLQAKAEN